MSETVKIMGDTPKEQWMSTIGIFEMCICENAREVRRSLQDGCDIDEEKCGIADSYGDCVVCNKCHSLNIVVEQGHVFADEMRRLVEGVFE